MSIVSIIKDYGMPSAQVATLVTVTGASLYSPDFKTSSVFGVLGSVLGIYGVIEMQHSFRQREVKPIALCLQVVTIALGIGQIFLAYRSFNDSITELSGNP